MSESNAQRKPYEAPRLHEHGSIEKLTGWIGGPWGEFFGGTNSGWNPWKQPGNGGGGGGGLGS